MRILFIANDYFLDTIESKLQIPTNHILDIYKKALEQF